MNAQPRQLPSPAAAWHGAVLALENAERQLRAAEFLAVFEERGIAVSHLVVAAKEVVKSIILLRHALGLQVPASELTLLLYERRLRYALAATHVPLLALVQRVAELFPEADGGAAGAASVERRRQQEEALRAAARELQEQAERTRESNEILLALDWLNDSSVRGNAVLYVDFRGHGWSPAGQVEREEYVRALALVQRLVGEQRAAVTRWADLPAPVRVAAFRALREATPAAAPTPAPDARPGESDPAARVGGREGRRAVASTRRLPAGDLRRPAS